MYIHYVCAGHPAEVLRIFLFNTSTFRHVAYENKKVPSCDAPYGTEFTCLKLSE